MSARAFRAGGRVAGIAAIVLWGAAAIAQEQGAPPPGQVEETVTVTATRLPTAMSDLATSTRVVGSGALRLRPGLGIDEALAWEPGFSLFRRSPARSAHPTTHGVSLRGVAPTGTSRALVLVDGAPLADAFGGWTQWDRVPPEVIDRVEIAYGGGSAPWGNQALAGTIRLVTLDPRADRSVIQARVGARSEWETSAAWSSAGLRTLVAGRAYGSDRYHAVTAIDRGAIDRPVGARGFALWLAGAPADGLRITVDGFRADRDNGTPAQTNRVEGVGAAIGWRSDGDGPAASIDAWVRRSRLESTFSAIADNRDSELPVLDQRVPSTDVGGAALLGRRPSDTVDVTLGADLRHVSGRSQEDVLTAGFSRAPGGAQTIGGLWGAVRVAGDATLAAEASLRADAWRNRPDGQGATREATNLAPRLGLVWQPAPDWSARVAGYGGFRAPTLNELYRQFRVGDVSTAANPDLEPERSWGGEVGLIWHAGGARAPLRIELAGYLTRLDDPVVNATVEVREDLVLRRRENLGAARTGGLELDVRWRPAGGLELGVGAAWMSGRVLAAEDPALVGNRLPQVPDWRATASSSWTAAAGWTVLAAVHATGRQFEDDRNELQLAPGATVDAALEWPLDERVSLSLRVQNLLDERLEVGRTPVLTIGPPRTASLGIRLVPGRR